MKSLILLFLLSLSTHFCFAQNIDYNTKKRFAVNGYDVVAYFNNTATEGENKYIIAYDGVNYKFSSEENLNLFKGSPEKYLPQYGGYCAYAIAYKSKKVSINPETYLIKDNRLFLFYNAWGTNTLKLWNDENHNALSVMADKNWEMIKYK